MGSGIYKILNTASGKCYVGSTIDIDNRFHGHKRHLRRGKHKNKHLQSAWDKYGEAAFVFSVLEFRAEEHLIRREQVWIDRLRSADQAFGYNQAPVAGAVRGFRWSGKSRRKISKIVKDRWETDPEGYGNSGKTHSVETRRKMSLRKIGNKNAAGERSEEFGQQMSKINKNRKHTAKACRNMGKSKIIWWASSESAEARHRRTLPEVRHKLSEAIKLAWKMRKERESQPQP